MAHVNVTDLLWLYFSLIGCATWLHINNTHTWLACHYDDAGYSDELTHTTSTDLAELE